MTNEEGGHMIVESDTDTVIVLVHVTTGHYCPICVLMLLFLYFKFKLILFLIKFIF